MWRNKKLWGVLIIICLSACWLMAEKSNLSEKAAPPVSPRKVMATEISYLAADIGEMEAEFQQNAVMAREKYANKYVKLTGRVLSIGKRGAHYQISLVKTDKERSFVLINCRLKQDDAAQLAFVQQAQKGQTVTVYGRLNDISPSQGYVYTLETERFE